MARIRSIKPGFFTSTTNADLPKATRLTYIGLWTYVDDEGRAQDDARLVKAAVWPLDDDYPTRKVEKDLTYLETANKIRRYKVDGRAYLQVCNWKDHQKINHPQPSIIPSVEDSLNVQGTIPEEDRNVPGGKGMEGIGGEGIPSSTAAVIAANGHAPWSIAVSQELAKIDTSGSWDLVDSYVVAWDRIHDSTKLTEDQKMPNLIALTSDYVARVTDEDVGQDGRKLIAMTVRNNGKVALLGWSKALGTTETDSGRDRFRYARGVINRFIAEQEGAR